MKFHNTRNKKMINEEAAKVLLDASKNIYLWAKKGDKEKETVVSKRAHEAAWRAVVHLIPVLEHAKESDLYWTLLDNAINLNKSAKEQQRLHTIAKQEDREFMRSKAELEKLISEAAFIEKADPRGLAEKAEADMRRKNDIAGQARRAEEATIGKALKLAKTVKEKKELSKRYEAASAVFMDAQHKAEEETEAVYLKLGLTPRFPSDKFLKAQKASKKAAAKKAN
jgi:hypothetical protein